MLGKADLSASTYTTLYTVPAGKEATVNVNICNRSGDVATVDIAIAAAGTPVASEFIVYQEEIPYPGGLEKTGIVAQAGDLIVVRSDIASVSAQVWGIGE